MTAARDRLARRLRGDQETAFNAGLTPGMDDLSLAVEGCGLVRFPVTPAKARKLATLGQPARFGPVRRPSTSGDAARVCAVCGATGQ